MQHKCDSLEILSDNVSLVHHTRPHVTKGDGISKVLSIKGPMMGISIGSNNHIKKRKSEWNWALVQLRKLLELMQCRGREAIRNK